MEVLNLTGKNECVWCNEIIQNNEKSVKLSFIGKADPLVINFHLIHYGIFSVWLEEKAKFEKNYKFKDFSNLSNKDREEEEKVAKEQGLYADFKEDCYNLNNVLLNKTIGKTFKEQATCPVTEELVELWSCLACSIQNCPKDEYYFSIQLEE